MRILVDRHHSGLSNSLVLLFQKRLGWELFFQKGMEWYPEFWDLQPFKETAQQYLERELEGLPGIRLEEFKNTKFDVILCSLPQHVNKFIKLRDLYQPQAKMIMQIGNQWTFDHSFPIKNILASAKIPHLMGFNQAEYHQEFDLETFSLTPPNNNHKIFAFNHGLGGVDLYRLDWELFLSIEKLMPDWEFKAFGGLCRDGKIEPDRLADKMKEATFIYQVKREGDGFGYSLHQAAAIGRPLITRYSDYAGKLAEPFMNWDMTISVDNRSPEALAEDIKRAFEQREEMGKRIYEKFKTTVNFDKEQKVIEQFLTNLV